MKKANEYCNIEDLISQYKKKKKGCDSILEVYKDDFTPDHIKKWQTFSKMYADMIADLEMVKKSQEVLLKGVYLDGQLSGLLCAADGTKRVTAEEYLKTEFPKRLRSKNTGN